MWKAPRSHDPLLGIVHVNVGPEREGAADSLYRFIQGQTGGYHEIVDNKKVIVCAGDREMVAGAKGGRANRDGKHYCVIGMPGQTTAEWGDSYSAAAVVLLSVRMADDAKQYGWQVRRLRPAEVATAGVKGLCGHKDVTDAFNVAGGHWDPGPNFPWQRLVDLINQQLNQGTGSGGGNIEVPTATTRMDAFRHPSYDKPVVLHADGGVFDHSGAMPFGALPALVQLQMGVNHAISILPYPDYGGYWILGVDGAVYSFYDKKNGHQDWYRGNAVDLPKFGCQAVELQANGNGYDILWECVAPGVINAGAIKYPA